MSLFVFSAYTHPTDVSRTLRSYSHYPHPSLLRSQPSSYRPTQFAQNVIQLSVPTSSYHTPPPGIMNTSSSLAFALGGPPSAPPAKVYQPASSAEFFDGYIAKAKQEITHPPSTPSIDKDSQATPTQQKPDQPPPQESPDPLALKAKTQQPASPSQVPRKRKVYVEVESPAKRFHSIKASITTPQSSTQTTPTVSPTKSPLKRTATLAYVEVPPAPWLTPLSSRKSFTGCGSDYSPTKCSDTIKSSRRTGDRDERGTCLGDDAHNTGCPEEHSQLPWRN